MPSIRATAANALARIDWSLDRNARSRNTSDSASPRAAAASTHRTAALCAVHPRMVVDIISFPVSFAVHRMGIPLLRLSTSLSQDLLDGIKYIAADRRRADGSVLVAAVDEMIINAL